MSIDSKMTALADEIRELSGTSEAIGLDAMKTHIDEANDEVASQVELLAQAVTALEGKISGGNSELMRQIIRGTVTEISDNNIKSIRRHAFHGCTSLSAVSFPTCSIIGREAFRDCESFTTVSFPQVKVIHDSAFTSCINLATVSFPITRSIYDSAFYNCRSLSAVSFPFATTISNYAFGYCRSLTTASLPAVSTIGYSAFYSCNTLTSVFLAKKTIATLSHSNAFSKTPMSTTGWFYVPSSLISSYQVATNWVYYSSRFSAIENSPDWNGEYDGDIIEGMIWFNFFGADHQAKEGTTWREWINSEDNTYGFYTDGIYILRETESFAMPGMMVSEYIYNNDWTETLIDDIIINNHQYWVAEE